MGPSGVRGPGGACSAHCSESGVKSDDDDSQITGSPEERESGDSSPTCWSVPPGEFDVDDSEITGSLGEGREGSTTAEGSSLPPFEKLSW